MKIGTNTQYTKTYRNMLGVDLSLGGADSYGQRYAYMENMYRDYDGADSSVIESVPGFRKLTNLKGTVYGIYRHKNKEGEELAVVHAGKNVYCLKTSDSDELESMTVATSIIDKKSHAFRFGNRLHLINGHQIVEISDEGTGQILNSDSENVYVPTTFYNGERIEQKNLLTDRFREKYIIGAAETVIYGSAGLLYRITDEQRGLCAVSGVSSTFSGILNIPSYVMIGTKRYKVDEISDNAFSGNQNILGVKFGIGIYRVGKYAFSGCTKLGAVFAYNAPRFIDDFVFNGCEALTAFILGEDLEKLGEGVFEGCSSLKMIRYSSDIKNFHKVENYEVVGDISVYSFQTDFSLTLEIPIYTPTSEIISVTLDGNELSDYTIENKEGRKKSLLFTTSDLRSIEGKEVVIYARATTDTSDAPDGVSDFLSDYGYSGTGFDALAGCRICENFDGRVFLSGNPKLPGVVFFSSRENGASSPLHFGSYNYFCDGFGVFGVKTMLSSGDSLIVFKSADDGGGSIFYHTPKETSIGFMPKIYPVTNMHNGIGAIGESFSFFDDPVFISKAGISAIEKKNASLDKSIACRSHNVNAQLLCESLSEASLVEWCGYLAVGVNGKIYLADSRDVFTHPSGFKEYEWYLMKDIGTWTGESTVYRFAHTPREGYLLHSEPDSAAEKGIYSVTTAEGKIYYTFINSKKYEVYPTEEKKGGTFNPLVALCSFDGDALFFGTQNGDLCKFNNDKRGVAPDFIREAADFNEEEYKKCFGRRIHPYFYSFAGHPMTCGVRTAPSDCGRPDLTKNTAKHSLTLKCRLSGNGKIRCEVRTDRSGYTEHCAFPNGSTDFSDFSFLSLSFETEDSISIPVKEKEKNWIDKEIAVYSNDFCTPIGIYSLSYRYTLRGKIKQS